MNRDSVILFIQKQYHDGGGLYSTFVRNNHPSVFHAAKKHFGSWKNAVESSGIQHRDVAKSLKWTKDEIIKALKSLPEEDLVEKHFRKKHGALYNACIKVFGSRKKALIASGIDYESTLQYIPWTRERIISSIQIFHLKKLPLNFKYISTYHSRLKRRAEKFFGSWGKAVEAAGLDYDEIKKNKGWAKPSLGEDGILYASQIESLVANKLYKLKEEKRIVNYTPQADVVPGRKWTCDFSIKLLNGADFLLEVDGLGDNRKKAEQFKEKLDFYDQAGVLYYKVFSPNNIENIIDRFTSWYSIPIKNSIITSHKNPDGDALASSVALYKHLESNGKSVALRLSGKIPRNLEWIVSGCNMVKKLPDWTESIIVLDCAPMTDRIGWELPKNVPIYNIDHHVSRINDNDPDNNIHVIDACSTSSILFNFFGISNDILVVGVYTDTLFIKRLTEVFNFLSKINMDEQKISKYISVINANPDKKLWKLLNESNVHRCRNGFIIVEILEDSPDVIESFMQILSKLSESVCLIYGKDSSVKLRTSNTALDVSEIAKQYGGGGHPYASMCSANGKLSEFKSKIVSLEVPKLIEMDGYGESKNEKPSK
jgi:phosphoesterase RecJ-like protein